MFVLKLPFLCLLKVNKIPIKKKKKKIVNKNLYLSLVQGPRMT